MIEILIFIITNLLYVFQENNLLCLLVIILLVANVYRKGILKYILLASSLYAINIHFFYVINYFCTLFMPDSLYSYGITYILIAILHGLVASLYIEIKVEPIRNQRYVFLIVFLSSVLISIYNIEHFAYSQALFILYIVIVHGFSYIMFSVFLNVKINVDETRRVAVANLAIIFMLCILGSVYESKKSVHCVAWPQGAGVWASNKEPYDKKEWSMKSYYSYSVLKEMINNKYKLVEYDGQIDDRYEAADAIIIITPTKPFNDNEKRYIDQYIKKGGNVIYVVDHTDLFGHARVVNNIINKYGIEINYDAVYSPDNPYKTAFMTNNPFSNKIRPMVGCSVSIKRPCYVGGLNVSFISEKADYTKPNFFGEKRWTPDDKIGNWPLYIKVAVGRGRITLCSDSTIFSNFAIFQPGVLNLLDRLFEDGDLGCLISKNVFIALALIITLFTVMARSKAIWREILLIIIFIIIVILSEMFILYKDDTMRYYQKEKILFVRADSGLIYEPQDETQNWNISVSNLMANMPRYGIYPYYAKWYERNKYNYNELVIQKNKIKKYIKWKKYLIVNDEKEKDKANVMYANNQFTDEILGTWWVSLGISPYRKSRFEEFSLWLKGENRKGHFEYPALSLKKGSKEIILRNDKGEIYKKHYDTITIYEYDGIKYVYIEDCVWGIYIEKDGKKYLLGGPEMNDKRDVKFYNYRWYAEIP